MDKITIQELHNDFLVCRAIGHSWDENPTAQVDSDLWRSSRGAIMLRCVRCHTERFDYLDNQMQVFQRYYRYPDHYTTIPGYKKPDLRAELFSRSLLIKRRRNGRRP